MPKELLTMPDQSPESSAARNLRGVVFDQDGTLINTFIPAMHAYSVAVGREITLAELEPVAHLGAARNLVSALLGREATDEDDEIFHDALAAEVSLIDPYDGIVELLAALRRAGVATGLATNSDSRSASIVLGSHGLDELLDTIVTVDLVGGPKPSPESILLAVANLGLDPSEVAFVGDSNADMVASRAAGVLAVAAGWGQQAPGIRGENVDLWLETPAQVLDLVAQGR
jgi:HAD superfamily hydrolase (TIGR01509 family)